jgi:hypothetical protein
MSKPSAKTLTKNPCSSSFPIRPSIQTMNMIEESLDGLHSRSNPAFAVIGKSILVEDELHHLHNVPIKTSFEKLM